MQLRQFPEKDQFIAMGHQHNVVPLCVELLADTETPVTLLKKFIEDRKADPKASIFLLESVEGGEHWGRYSFLGTSASHNIRIYQDKIKIENGKNQKVIAHQGNPIQYLREFMSGFNPPEIKDLPRFWGGIVGYLNYETVAFYESIPHQWPSHKPLAHFVLPDELLIFDNIRNTLMCVAVMILGDDCQADAAYDMGMEKLDKVLKTIEQQVHFENGRAVGQKYQITPTFPAEKYMENVEKIKKYIHAGDVIQTVISQPFTCSDVPDIWKLYRAQRYINPSPYMFFMQFHDLALVGSSPETMVRLENKVATVRPIAGTRARGKTEQADRELADDLLADEKERAEHLMLVDLGRNDLGRVAETGSVQVTDLMFIERYSHVMHLVSNITCDLKSDCDAWDLIAATFPAGTLSGAPKIRAMEIIAELEEVPRGPYGGAVGYISFNGNMDLAITIRTACIQDGKLTVQAGAGIVADSDPEKENEESINKAKAIQRALQML